MTAAAALVPALAARVRPLGLNLIGATRPADYDALVPPAHRLGARAAGTASIVVLGNGGGAFWGAFRARRDADPVLAADPDPLDAFTVAVVEAQVRPLLADLGIVGEVRFPFAAGDPPLSFVHLAEAAGLGRRGLLRVLIHPEFGPWLALRAAILLPIAVAAPRPAAGFDPCARCLDRPCVAACPGVTVRWPDGWDVPACIDHRTAAPADPCAGGCFSRLACVYGRAAHYPEDALTYHQARAFAVMRAYARRPGG